MDMREIEQLHAQYAQPALTIDISPSPARSSTPPLWLGNDNSGGFGKEASAPAGGNLSVPPRALWAAVFVVGAAAMFLIGSSMGKRDARTHSSDGPAAAVTASEAGPSAASQAEPEPHSHEWPVRGDANNVTSPTPASGAAPLAAAADTPRITLPSQEPVKPIAPAPKPAPAPAAPAAAASAPAKAAAPVVPAQIARPAVSPQAAPNREIKLF
ncbi:MULTISPECIES: hypothetical protein [Cupriavidus]|uniref:Transmembrane protein n=2 Tax=Cupriavidus metallidurans TaxID=119219 RepID=Q5NUY4_CUPMC|nr:MULTISPECIES: hypothetical protein [Cupriavidus]ABF13083.1 conserved hypothetical protein [Cupriavidus metallidurans CH34]QGS27379.1 hypothetical protein FOB83_00030 [Cupriavidus metallidurans]CAI30218.1 hypothetical protein RMe0074 [Cupriavidus metallidurans CH34]